MRTNERLNVWWSLAREDSDDGRTLRRRIAAINAMMLLVCGFLLAIGLRVVVLAFLAGLLVALGAVLVTAALPRARQRLERSMPVWRSRGRAASASVVPVWREARGTTVSGLVSGRRRVAALAASVYESGSRTGRQLAQAGSAGAARLASQLTAADPWREALRLNAAGSELRRNGRFAEAAECHRRALDILRALDDRRAIALTESNLALALSHAGDDHWAIGLFEEAAATLRELGDEEHEAQIMANLGLAHRRHGCAEEVDSMLRLALSKLSPASTAYRTIESELVRASPQS
jgi:tetratricopeptide (TPR) repeat protein